MCKVGVIDGEYVVRTMSRAQVSAADAAAGIGLACRMYPRSDLRVQVLGAVRRRILPAQALADGGKRE